MCYHISGVNRNRADCISVHDSDVLIENHAENCTENRCFMGICELRFP